MDHAGLRQNCFWSYRAKMRPKSLPLRNPFWMKNERHAAWERDFFKKDERRVAWERFFLKRALSHKSRRVPPRVHGVHLAKRKTSATLHGSASFSKWRFRINPAEPRREWMTGMSQNAKRAPRCMGALLFQKCERRAAWERLCAEA